MRKNVFGVKNITSLIYGLVMLLPFFAILGRVIYSQSNPNAKDSYSAKQSLTYELTETDTIVNKEMYLLTIDNRLNLQVNLPFIDISSLNVISGIINVPTNPTSLRLYYNNNNLTYSLQINGDTTTYTVVGNTTTISRFQLNFVVSSNYDSNGYGDNLLEYVFSQQQSLDNAFEYSLISFTEDNNMGNVDMFSWFTDMFLDQSNAHNMIYIGFVNWYLNYAMLVSSGYLFFLVLIWFVNFVRRILDKSMYQEYGGF